MIRAKSILSLLLVLSALVAISASLSAQTGGRRPADGRRLQQPIYRVAQAPGDGAQQAAAQGQHPLDPAIEIAKSALQNIKDNVRDYSCTMVKRERINGKVEDEEFLFVKIRHEPFSVYTYFLAPSKLKGQEAIYVAGRNDGNLLGHGVGIQKVVGTVSLKPTSPMAMRGQRYPITEIGFLNLTKRLVDVAQNDRQFGECEVKFQKAKINKRPCTMIKVVHPYPRRNFLFHEARVFLDDELNVPVRYEAYDWPSEQGGQPQLIEQYTYVDIKINQGFTDTDFDVHNPNYGF